MKCHSQGHRPDALNDLFPDHNINQEVRESAKRQHAETFPLLSIK